MFLITIQLKKTTMAGTLFLFVFDLLISNGSVYLT